MKKYIERQLLLAKSRPQERRLKSGDEPTRNIKSMNDEHKRIDKQHLELIGVLSPYWAWRGGHCPVGL